MTQKLTATRMTEKSVPDHRRYLKFLSPASQMDPKRVHDDLINELKDCEAKLRDCNTDAQHCMQSSRNCQRAVAELNGSLTAVSATVVDMPTSTVNMPASETEIMRRSGFCETGWSKPLALLRLCPQKFPFNKIVDPIETYALPTSGPNFTGAQGTISATPVIWTTKVEPVTSTTTVEKYKYFTKTNIVDTTTQKYLTSISTETLLTKTEYVPITTTTTFPYTRTITDTRTRTRTKTTFTTTTASVTRSALPRPGNPNSGRCMSEFCEWMDGIGAEAEGTANFGGYEPWQYYFVGFMLAVIFYHIVLTFSNWVDGRFHRYLYNRARRELQAEEDDADNGTSYGILAIKADTEKQDKVDAIGRTELGSGGGLAETVKTKAHVADDNDSALEQQLEPDRHEIGLAGNLSDQDERKVNATDGNDNLEHLEPNQHQWGRRVNSAQKSYMSFKDKEPYRTKALVQQYPVYPRETHETTYKSPAAASSQVEQIRTDENVPEQPNKHETNIVDSGEGKIVAVIPATLELSGGAATIVQNLETDVSGAGDTGLSHVYAHLDAFKPDGIQEASPLSAVSPKTLVQELTNTQQHSNTSVVRGPPKAGSASNETSALSQILGDLDMGLSADRRVRGKNENKNDQTGKGKLSHWGEAVIGGQALKQPEEQMSRGDAPNVGVEAPTTSTPKATNKTSPAKQIKKSSKIPTNTSTNELVHPRKEQESPQKTGDVSYDPDYTLAKRTFGASS